MSVKKRVIMNQQSNGTSNEVLYDSVQQPPSDSDASFMVPNDISVQCLDDAGRDILIGAGFSALETLIQFIVDAGVDRCKRIGNRLRNGFKDSLIGLINELRICVAMFPIYIILFSFHFSLIELIGDPRVKPVKGSLDSFEKNDVAMPSSLRQYGYTDLKSYIIRDPKFFGLQLPHDASPEFQVEFLVARHIEGYTTVFTGGESQAHLIEAIQSFKPGKSNLSRKQGEVFTSFSFKSTPYSEAQRLREQTTDIPTLGKKLLDYTLKKPLCFSHVFTSNAVDAVPDITLTGQAYVNGWGSISPSCLP